jgi:hypothetical protein
LFIGNRGLLGFINTRQHGRLLVNLMRFTLDLRYGVVMLTLDKVTDNILVSLRKCNGNDSKVVPSSVLLRNAMLPLSGVANIDP